jgi:Family of unknown function (DUF6644)
MIDAIYPLFEWLEASWLGQFIRVSLWLFPVIESFHLVSFALLGGTVLMSDLRILGFIFKDQVPASLDKTLRPWFRLGLTVTIVSGLLLFISEAVKCFYSTPFRIKITCLILAILFTVTVRKRLVDKADTGPTAATAKLAAVISIALWATVAWGGRWIGFSG